MGPQLIPSLLYDSYVGKILMIKHCIVLITFVHLLYRARMAYSENVSVGFEVIDINGLWLVKDL